MEKMNRLYQGLWEADEVKMVEIMQELMDLIKEAPKYVAEYLIREARKTPERKYKLIALIENLELEEAGYFIKETLKSEEDGLVGRQISIEKAVKNGWDQNGKKAEWLKVFDVDAETQKYGCIKYGIKLNLDNSHKIKDITRHVMWEDKPGEISGASFFPVMMHARYMKEMEGLI